MRSIIRAVILAMMALGAAAQTVPSQSNGAAPAPGATQAAQNISILKPAAGEKLRQNFVTITYSLSNPAASAAGTPNFQLRIDAQDVITTTSTEYTFSGLTPGAHTVTVQLVDANGTPISGSQAVVKFSVVRDTAQMRGPKAIEAALRLDPSSIRVQEPTQAPIPNAGGALPLLSVIGFGVLLGGIASAMKTRPKP
jgi:hypothetical protein